ncbi:hypothetical protein BJ165DRAFT_1404940 [Panaeolus papilionaceus]|nr:hypothetical protein BJ165DRAFT_1404940 [Panaeolus papilionaceus]
MTESIPARKHWYSPTADVIRTSFKQLKGFIKGKKPGQEKGQSNSQPYERPIVSAAPSLEQNIPEHISTPRSDPTQLDAPAAASRSDEVPSPEPTHCLPQVLPLPVQAVILSPSLLKGFIDHPSLSTPITSALDNQPTETLGDPVFPVEIFGLIIEDLASGLIRKPDAVGDIRACSLVCKGFVSLCRPHLFRRISIGRNERERGALGLLTYVLGQNPEIQDFINEEYECSSRTTLRPIESFTKPHVADSGS